VAGRGQPASRPHSQDGPELVRKSPRGGRVRMRVFPTRIRGYLRIDATDEKDDQTKHAQHDLTLRMSAL
jgi:hypothetical protein